METTGHAGRDGDGTPAAAHAVVAAGGSVQLPADIGLHDLAFSRVGSDLVLSAPDGASVIVGDFFSSDAPPDLLFDGGRRISGELAERLAGPQAPGAYAQAGATSPGEPIGTVESIGGQVTATHPDGVVVVLQVGDAVYQGDIVQSDAAGGIGVVLADGTTFSMGPSGRMVLDEMIYDPSGPDGSLAISVLEGVFTFVSGQVAKASPDAMTVDTPMATIGIRGTQIGLDVPPDGPMNAYMLQESNGLTGEATFTGDGWTQVLNIGLQGLTIVGPTVPPAPPFFVSVEEVVARLGGAFGYLPPEGGANSYGVEPQGGGAPGDSGSAAASPAEEGQGPGPQGDGPDDGAPPGGPDAPPDPGLGQQPPPLPAGLTGIVGPEGLGGLFPGGPFSGIPGGFPGGPPAPPPAAPPPPPGGGGERENEGPPSTATPGQSITGTSGPDNLSGGEGDDSLFGLDGADFLFGNGGNDLLDGGEGADHLSGGPGFDTFRFKGGEGSDTITDFSFGDNIRLVGFFTNEVSAGPQSGTDHVIASGDAGFIAIALQGHNGDSYAIHQDGNDVVVTRRRRSPPSPVSP